MPPVYGVGVVDARVVMTFFPSDTRERALEAVVSSVSSQR